jgi:hypothetical protein
VADAAKQNLTTRHFATARRVERVLFREEVLGERFAAADS